MNDIRVARLALPIWWWGKLKQREIKAIAWLLFFVYCFCLQAVGVARLASPIWWWGRIKQTEIKAIA